MSWPQDVTRADLHVEFLTGSGKGGQRRNRRKTACRITHRPTGKVGYSEDHAHGGQNRRAAFRRLADQLVPLMRAELAPAAMEYRGRISETPMVRTYNEKRGEVKDPRLPGLRFSYYAVLDGPALEDLIHALIMEQPKEEA